MAKVPHRIARVRELVGIINKCQEEISDIEKSCPHLRIRHKLYQDIYAGQGESSSCADCGKSFGFSTSHASPVITKTWIENTSKRTSK